MLKVKAKLQELTNNSSDNMSILFHNFEELYPEERGTITLLRSFLFSENSSITLKNVMDALNQIN